MTYFAPNQWNARCGECGRQYKAFELRKRWDGWLVCRSCWEIRNPQDFVRGVPDRQQVPWSQNPPDVLVFRGQSTRVIGSYLVDSQTLG